VGVRESPEHAALVELFRHHPELAATLAARVGRITLPKGYGVRVGDPTQRAFHLVPDLVIEVCDADGTPVLALIVEVQREVDPDKRFTWPAYQWLERLRRRCECVVLVVATTRKVAAWASPPIECGTSVSQVIVLGPDDVPRITDLAVATANPGLAVLSAAIHGGEGEGEPVTRAACLAQYTLHEHEAQQYNELVFHALSRQAVRHIIEDLMHELSEQQEQERRADIEQLKRLLTELYEVKGERNATARLLLRQLAIRGFQVDEATSARVRDCRDLAQLETWFDRVVTAKTLDEVFAD
jgi:hypothetical protein